MTLVIEEELRLAARKVAPDRGTSMHHLVREYLAALVEQPGRRRQARSRLKQAFDPGLAEAGDRMWSRDDLHER